MTDCPNSLDKKHKFNITVGSGIRGDFEPTQYGDTAEDTLYKRVEYSIMGCSCGTVRKAKVLQDA